ncbi:MAG: glycoside hydrolase [Chloroflexi bacterium RBG_16_50_9]|nr:MAG: glycoside hydrolase [Chloroflexi bacterium RBG_16_50_9]
MERYVCIHSHFYQPPRENPWLESIELQYSAYPYHDWNERITAECYAPNATSRILDSKKRITEIVNNYIKISFNFGPTILAWMEANAPEVFMAILLADHESQKSFSGHGSAMAQAYNHMIMPLANRQDKYTQVLWGIRDFEHRFQRQPEGMWLPETALDPETLDIMAELGIKFTILAPHQAKRVRQIGTDNWEDVDGGRIDPTRAYAVNLPSGRKLSLFFYDGPVSHAIAFEGLLANGESFADRLMGVFSDQRDWPQLVHIATDGESYGHHHRNGDMALAYALHHIEANPQVKITNYGEYLEKHPPTHEVEIVENSSWSCVHGIERWRSDCGCNSGGHAEWNQSWRAPLRQALDWLRDTLAPTYEEKAREYLKDPWAARNEYIAVILDRTPESVQQFLSRHATHELSEPERIKVLKLLELQRHAMLMYTSCGWFFDELSGIETVQVIQYAGRVVQLAQELFGDSIEEQFLKLLEAAKSNLPEHGDGRRIYDKWVKPATIDLAKVAAHYAISSLFQEYGEHSKIYCYAVDRQAYQKGECGKTRIAVGRVNVTSEITQESQALSFGVAHFSDHNLSAGVRKYRGEEAFNEMLQELIQTCSVADFPGVIRLLDKHFGTSTYALRSLFRDEQNKVLGNILQLTLNETESAYRQIYQSHYPLMRFLINLGNPLPKGLQFAAEFILNTDLRRALSADTPDVAAIKKFLEETGLWKVQLDTSGLAHVFRQTLEKKMFDFVNKPEDVAIMSEMIALVELAQSLPFAVELRGVQNLCHPMLKKTFPEFQKRAKGEDQLAKDWVARFVSLGDKLAIRIL